MKKRLPVFLAVLSLSIAFSCSKASKLNKLAEDSSLSDQKAISQMVGVIWEHTVESKRKVKVSKSAAGLIVYIQITGYPMSTGVRQKYYKKITLSGAAKYMWRLFRYGEKRHISQVIVNYIKPLATAPRFNLYSASLTLNQLQKVEGWNTLDPYNSGEYDILDESVRHIPLNIMQVWSLPVDNFDKIIIR